MRARDQTRSLEFGGWSLGSDRRVQGLWSTDDLQQKLGGTGVGV